MILRTPKGAKNHAVSFLPDAYQYRSNVDLTSCVDSSDMQFNNY